MNPSEENEIILSRNPDDKYMDSVWLLKKEESKGCHPDILVHMNKEMVKY